MYPSYDTVVFTWGKHSGKTLGTVLRSDPQYLQWIVKTPAIPANWSLAAKRVLSNEDIIDISLPKVKMSEKSTTQTPIMDKPIIVDLVSAKTAFAHIPYNKLLMEQFKYEIDGRKWNADEKHWEFPAVHLPKMKKTFPTARFSEKAEKLLSKLQERRNDLDEIRQKEDDSEYAKQFNNIIHVGKILNWNELNTNLQKMLIEFEFEGKRKKFTEEQFIQFLEKNEYTLDIEGNICKNTGVLKLPLYGYQVIGTKFIDRAGGRCLIADAPGLGKTVQAIAYAQLHNLKTLIVCPLSVVVNWQREIKKFTGKDSTIWDSKGYVGIVESQFHITHYDAVSKNSEWLRKQEFDLLVCDEATYLKNRQTIRAKSILGSWKERRKFPGVKTKYVIFLTGTPVMSRPVEAFSLLNFLDKERFNNFYHFVQRYGGWKGQQPINLQDLHDRTKDLVIRRKKDQVLKEMPQKQRNDVYVELSKTEKKEYNELLKEMFGKWKMEGKPSVQHMPKLQGFLIEKKLPRLIEMIDEFIDNDRSILIFSCYIKPLKQLLEHYKDSAALLTGEMNKVERQQSIDRLTKREAKVGLFSLRAAGMGIDGLQHVMDTVVFIDMGWLPAEHEQAEDRTHRIGQKNQVQAYYMVCENTIDEYMREILKEKQNIADMIVDGALVTPERNKSMFRELVKRINSSHNQYFELEKIED